MFVCFQISYIKNSYWNFQSNSELKRFSLTPFIFHLYLLSLTPEVLVLSTTNSLPHPTPPTQGFQSDNPNATTISMMAENRQPFWKIRVKNSEHGNAEELSRKRLCWPHVTVGSFHYCWNFSYCILLVRILFFSVIDSKNHGLYPLGVHTCLWTGEAWGCGTAGSRNECGAGNPPMPVSSRFVSHPNMWG